MYISTEDKIKIMRLAVSLSGIHFKDDFEHTEAETINLKQAEHEKKGWKDD